MSWASLRAITEEAKRIRKEEAEKPITHCPYDGEPLVYNSVKRIWGCPDGHYYRV